MSQGLEPPWQAELERAQQAASTAAVGDHEAALEALLRAWGNNSVALLDVAVLLLQSGHLQRAEALLLWCHQLDPQSHRPLLNLANLWLQTLRQEKSLALLRQLPPSSNRLMALAYQEGCTAALALDEARTWFDVVLPQSVCVPLATPEKSANATLRIGFLSADLCQHPVGLFLLPLALALSARSDVDLVFYDNSSRSDWLTHSLQCCGAWRPVAAATDPQLAQQIQRDQLDVLLELGGHTARSRLAVLALRPAPVQLSWLGYWASTGSVTAVDAVLVDVLVVPPGSPEAASFCEPLLPLAQGRWCYRPVPWMPEVVDPPCLSQGWVTFGSFNHGAKLSRSVLLCWAELLRAVPSSRLLLKNYQLQDSQLQNRLRALMAFQGVEPDRLELQGPGFHADLLATYEQVDIALDPFPFNGGLTSCEALWLGLPLVTLAGHDQAAVMAARQGVALLEQIGRPEWVASSTDQYVHIATSLAFHPEDLRVLRHSQRARMQASPLCDQQGFSTAFLDGIQQAIKRQSSRIEHRVKP